MHCLQIWKNKSEEFLFSSSHDGELIIWNINLTVREIMNPEIKDLKPKKLKFGESELISVQRYESEFFISDNLVSSRATIRHRYKIGGKLGNIRLDNRKGFVFICTLDSKKVLRFNIDLKKLEIDLKSKKETVSKFRSLLGQSLNCLRGKSIISPNADVYKRSERIRHRKREERIDQDSANQEDVNSNQFIMTTIMT